MDSSGVKRDQCFTVSAIERVSQMDHPFSRHLGLNWNSIWECVYVCVCSSLCEHVQSRGTSDPLLNLLCLMGSKIHFS